MKGTRTYQLVIILALLFIVSMVKGYGDYLGFSLDSMTMITDKTTTLTTSILKFYAEALALWKVMSPHKMMHEA